MYTLCFGIDAGITMIIGANYVSQSGNLLGPVEITDQFRRTGTIGATLNISDQFQGFIEFYDANTNEALALFSANPQEAENLDERISDLRHPPFGSGGIAFTYKVVDISNRPIAQCQVWVTSDQLGQNVIAGTLLTDSAGNVTFELDDGDWWLWQRHRAYNFQNPTSIRVG